MRGMVPADLYKIAWISDARISPDGSHVAFVRTQMDQEADDYRSAIWLVSSDGSEEPRQLTAGAKRDTAPRWAPDGKSLAFLSERDEAKPQLYLLPIDGGEARPLTNLPLGAGPAVWSPTGDRIAFVARTGTPPETDPKKTKPYRRITTLKYRLNGEGFIYANRKHIFVLEVTEGAEPQQLTDGDEWDDTNPTWSPDGRQIAFISPRHGSRDFDNNTALLAVSLATKAVRVILPANHIHSVPSWSPDGTTIAFTRKISQPGNSLVFLTDASGGNIRQLDREFDRNSGVAGGDSGEPPAWLAGGRLLFAAENRGTQHLATASEGSATEWCTSGPRMVTSFSVSADGSQIAFTATSTTSPAEVFVRDSSGQERQLTNLNAGFKSEVTLQPATHFTVPREEGVELDCWIIEPSGRQEDKAYPVLLNIHGGPFAQYGETFFDEFQVYAGAGYGVIFCNPRGGSGQDSEFAKAPATKLGTVDYEDVMACFDAALERMPWADQRKLGVIGGSYGGFMTSWIISHTRRFRAAVSERAVNDWYGMQGNSDIGATFNPVYLGANAFLNWDREAVFRQSPLTFANDIFTPVLILHSENDLRCPIEQAEQLYVALKLMRRDVEFVRFPDENHELSRSGKPTHRVDRFDVILDYFGRKMR